jgi:hypothetical protein
MDGQTQPSYYVFILCPLHIKRQDINIFNTFYVSFTPRVEVSKNTSTVPLRVVEGN